MRTLLAITVGLLGVPAFADDKSDDKKTAQVAHIKLAGGLDEGPADSASPFGPADETFRDTLARLAKAKADDNVKALLLEIGDVGAAGLFGFGKVDEMRAAVADFRASGKKAYAYMDSGTQKAYLVALACDSITLPESGDLNLTGLQVELTFFKNLLNHVGVQADYLRMGDFKSAGETFTRTEPTPESRKQYKLVLDDYFDHSLVDVLKKRVGDKAERLIDGGPYTAAAAKKAGLIDSIAYRGGLNDRIADGLKVDDVEILEDYGEKKSDTDLSSPFAILKLLSPSKKRKSPKPKIAIVYAVGAITTGKSGTSPLTGSSLGSDTLVEAINEVAADDTVKAIVLRVDSPGGSALASDLIWNALRAAGKPVVASMGDVAASGGYYISMGCDRIFAEPGTLTGSIGVVGGKFVTKGLFDWAGVNSTVLKRGRNAGIYSPETPFTNSERAAVRRSMETVYDQFLAKALDCRERAGVELTREELVALAGGRIWTGRQAKANKLIDELGTLDDAIAHAKKLAKVPDGEQLEVIELPEPPSLLDQLSGGLGLKLSAKGEATLAVLNEMPAARRRLRHLGAVLRLSRDRVWLMSPVGVEVR